MSMGEVNHDTQESALLAVERALSEASEDGCWMAAVWSVKDNELRLLTRTTWKFPVGDVTEALRQVQRTMATSQTLQVAPMGPLPRATAFSTGGSEDQRNE